MLLLSLCRMSAQQYTVKALPVKKTGPVHSPHKAALYSAIIPGAGQFYNKKYWKMPFIYAAGAGLGWMLWYEQSAMNYYSFNYQQSVNGNTYKIDPILLREGLNSDGLLSEKNRFNHWRDLAFIGCVAVYALNVLDAAVDAHLWHFDQKINDDLSLRCTPSALPVWGTQIPAPGLRLTVSLH